VPPANFTPQQVAVAMRLSLPLIIGSAAARERPLQWRAARAPDGRVMLSATNSGSAFERVQSLSVTTADGREQAVSTTATNSYVLAGAQRQWVVSAADIARELKLSITTRTGQSEQVLAIAP
jgi:fimbrial chaperone protein